MKDKKADKYDVAGEIDSAFKDISFQFDLDDYEELLKEAKSSLTPEMFVSKEEFEGILTEWILLFKEEISSTLLTESLDIIQMKYNELSNEVDKILKSVSGGATAEISTDQLPSFINQLMLLFEVRIVDLTKKQPKSDGSVCSEDQKKEFYYHLMNLAGSLSYKTINQQSSEKLFIEYFKGIDAKFSFVTVISYDDDQGIDPFEDIGEKNPFAANKEMDHLEDEANIEEYKQEINVAEQKGNQEKVLLLKKIVQYYVMKKNMDSQNERDSIDMMIDGVK